MACSELLMAQGPSLTPYLGECPPHPRPLLRCQGCESRSRDEQEPEAVTRSPSHHHCRGLGCQPASLSRSPGTSWWPQASLAALGKPGAHPAQVVPSRHSTGSGNVDSSISTGFGGRGIGGVTPYCLHVLAAHSALAPVGDLRDGSSQECAGCETPAGAGCEDGNGNGAGV